MGGATTAAGAAAAALSDRLAALQVGRDAAEGGSGGGVDAAPRAAGLEVPLQALRELVGWPVAYPEEATALGVAWPRGLLLHGPPGCGKTLLVQQVATEFGASLHPVAAGAVFGAYVGESERRLRDAFAAAGAEAAKGGLAVVFLDEVDALCPRREGQRQHEARVTAQLLALLDGAAGHCGGAAPGAGGGRVVVVAATNRPNALDPALRRPGRLDREVAVPVPGPEQRAAILRLHTRGLALAPDVNLRAIAAACHGYSGADLAALAREAAMAAFSSAAAVAAAGAAGFAALGPHGHSGSCGAAVGLEGAAAAGGASADGLVRAADFDTAAQRVGPSIVRGQQAEAAAVSWDDIGGYDAIKRRLQQATEWPLQRAAAFARLGLQAPRGVLLHGPPGCSKTMLARAAAAASGATFLPLSCAQLYSMYVGEGEATLRDAFARARMAAPSIIFLDEADAMAPGRGAAEGGDGGGSPDIALRLLSTLLTELDGLEAAPGVLLLAATNRPSALDPALLRPGRLDVLLYVPPPNEAGRLAALRIHTRDVPLAPDVDMPAIARATLRFTGAEVASLCREAALAALREDVDGATHVAARHFDTALAAAAPALALDQLFAYEEWGAAYRR